MINYRQADSRITKTKIFNARLAFSSESVAKRWHYFFDAFKPLDLSAHNNEAVYLYAVRYHRLLYILLNYETAVLFT